MHIYIYVCVCVYVWVCIEIARVRALPATKSSLQMYEKKRRKKNEDIAHASLRWIFHLSVYTIPFLTLPFGGPF